MCGMLPSSKNLSTCTPADSDKANKEPSVSDFGSVDMSVSSSQGNLASRARSSASSLFDSVKKAPSAKPNRSVADSMKYSAARTSYLQTSLSGNQQPGAMKTSSTKGGIQGTFSGSQGNYLQTIVETQKKPTHKKKKKSPAARSA